MDIATRIPIDQLIDKLRSSPADLPSTTWRLGADGNNRVLLSGLPPDDKAASILARLADEDDLVVRYNASGTPNVKVEQGLGAEVTPEFLVEVRARLQLLQSFAQPITYTLTTHNGYDQGQQGPEGHTEEKVVVEIGGCLRGGSPLQRELNTEYGSC